MTLLHRLAAHTAEKILKVRIVRPQTVARLFEEVHLTRFFGSFAVDCVFDVGANDGQYAHMLRTRVGYRGPIISFEPIPSLAESMRKKSVKDKYWYIEEAALADRAGSAPFKVMQSSQFSSFHSPSTKEVKIFADHAKVVEEIQVKVITLQDVFSKYAATLSFKRPFLKIDTQGHDLEVAKGAGEYIKSFVGIQTELAIKHIYENTPDYRSAIDYYQGKGFELSAFVPNNEGHFPQLIETDCIMYNTAMILG